jgi:hypothetical protein
VAKSSPFKDLANLTSFQAALDDPNHVWEFWAVGLDSSRSAIKLFSRELSHNNPHHLKGGGNLAGSAKQILSFFRIPLVANQTIIHFEKFIDFARARAMRYVRQRNNKGYRRFKLNTCIDSLVYQTN